MRLDTIKMFGPSSRDNRAEMYFWTFKLNIADLKYVFNIL